ncbi:MAG: putative DNA binding domain-containing protein [Planctomycetes bacterium]|nr:putative DNA binding domain-containing protein [Planctomycetota bacterium]
MNQASLRRLVSGGEGPSLELKRTTGELRQGLETVCAFLNTAGGCVLFGVNRKGIVEGQQVSEQTIHEVTAAFDRFEPPAVVQIERIKVSKGREVIALSVEANREGVPFIFDGRAFERIGNTTRKMPQERYETLLLDRAHARRRWENQPAVGVRLKDLDREEILRTREAAIEQRRISAGTSRKVEDIMERLGVLRDGVITQAAQILYGTRFLPDYPQGKLKLGRFRGTEITGDIVDNKQEHMHAFAMVREAMAWLDRTLPLAARFPKGTIFREDRLPVPAEALREILLNAVMHRDYSDAGGYVAVAVFDDRIEISSRGRLPSSVTVEDLLGPHQSELRNPLIAEAFHRTGAVEIWGRGTNRVIDECRHYGVAPPSFEERQGFVIVTFKATITETAAPSRPESRPELRPESRPESLDKRVLRSLGGRPLSRAELSARVGHKGVSGQLKKVIRDLVRLGVIEHTIPEKPNSRLQKYRLTTKSRRRSR